MRIGVRDASTTTEDITRGHHRLGGGHPPLPAAREEQAAGEGVRPA
ncbi:hypothetical protein [Actinoallomurus sp. CA-142502]